MVRNTYIYPPEPSMRIVGDIFEYTAKVGIFIYTRLMYCLKTVSSNKTASLYHGESFTHKKSCSAAKNQVVLSAGSKTQLGRSVYKETTVTQVVAFIAEHILPFSLSSHLLSLLQARGQKDAKEMASLQDIRMAATKCTNIVRQSTDVFFAKDLVEILRATRVHPPRATE